MNERIPPQDIDSEMALLGGMMVADTDSDLCDWTVEEIAAIVSAESFYVPAHQKLFDVLVDLRSDPARKCDLLIVSDELRSRDLLFYVGGQDYLIRLSESFADWANTKYYAEIVRRMQIKRAIIKLSENALQRGYDPLEEPTDIIADFAKNLDRLNRACVIDRVPVRECDLLNSFYHPDEGIQDHIPVALGRLGFALNGGLDRGSLTIIGARPSCGKTSMAVVLCYHASVAENGCNSLFISVEMTARQLASRFMAIRTGVAVSAIKSGEIDYEQFELERIRAVQDAKSGRTIFILDQTEEMGTIVAQIKSAVRKHEVGMVVVDYLGLLKIKGQYERNDKRVGDIVAVLKKLSGKENIAIVLLVQLNREVEHGSGRAPRMSDLRDSGEIEQHADNILLINPTGKIAGQDGDVVDCEIIVAKQRQGGTETMRIDYKKSTMIFESSMMAQAETFPNMNGTVPF